MAAKKRAENRAVSARGFNGVVPLASPTRDRPKGTRQPAGLLATILLDAYDAIWVHDISGCIRVWNSGAERMFGYTEAEALTMNAEALMPEETRAFVHAVCQRL